ncbi:MAG: hypothetical protein QNJ27_01255 [Simkaniaceae bacterium]|nr:hypothetical protein [Simkaniaceae bacterium]
MFVTYQVWVIDPAYNTNPRTIVILDIPSVAIINALPTIDNLPILAFAPISCIGAETRRN